LSRGQYEANSKRFTTALKAQCRGSGWRVAQQVAYRQAGGLFLHTWKNGVIADDGWTDRITLYFKPMAVDELLWTILDIPSDNMKRLSLRCQSAFTCSGLPIAEWSGLLTEEAPFQQFLQNAQKDAEAALAAYPFSDLCAKSLARVEFSNPLLGDQYLWPTFIVALIHEKEFDLALKVLESYRTFRRDQFTSYYKADREALGDDAPGYGFAEMARRYIQGRHGRIPNVKRSQARPLGTPLQ
jgi:hypothetical protein